MLLVAIAAAVYVSVAGCGFEPLHARKTGAAPSSLAEIRIETIADRIGQQLHKLLLDKLNPKGRPAAARYVLSVKLSESLQKLGVRKDEVATRANLVMRASFRLARANDDFTLLTASAISANSYNILRSDFATLSAENDARASAVRELSDEIRTRIGIYLSRNK
jgi:LPS-assembly lipoprotein